MISAARLPQPIHLAISILAGAVLGLTLGMALAQERRVGQLDTECVNRCTANGYETEFCGRVCWLPDPAIAAKAVPLDWICMTGCLERGGKFEDCRLACKRP